MIRTVTLLGAVTSWLQPAVSAFTLRPGVARGFRSTSLQSSTKSMAEKVLEDPKWPPEWPYTPEDFARMVRGCCSNEASLVTRSSVLISHSLLLSSRMQDESDDGIFYESARL